MDTTMEPATESDTACRVSLLTPPGLAAVAVIALDGPGALACLRKVFVPRSSRWQDRLPPNRTVLGSLYLTEDGRLTDEVLAVVRSHHEVEIHCHGGVQVVRRALERLGRLGCWEQSWHDRLRDKEADPIQAQAALALTAARTERAARMLLAQYSGSLRRELEYVLTQLAADNVAVAQSRVTALLGRASVGLHLTQPWDVVFLGPPNAGKSTLINRVLGYERAITDPRPGTTRDLVTAETAIDGWPVRLCDSAGIRPSDDMLERSGTARAEAAAATADLAVLVFDRTTVPREQHRQLCARWPDALLVANKCDLPCGTPRGDMGDKLRIDVETSAVTGTGVPELLAAIVERLVPHSPAEDVALPFTPELVALLESLEQRLRSARAGDARRLLEQFFAEKVGACD